MKCQVVCIENLLPNSSFIIFPVFRVRIFSVQKICIC
uniref:Uncharacterized protein n=1 Tax=Arundo donax TaxID=35708 RepID=A0A0A9B187_ARUDO